MTRPRVLAIVFLSVTVLSGVALLGQDRPASDREQFIGAWRLAWMEETGPDGKVTRTTDRTGTLMYTRDGRMSVQIQFPSRRQVCPTTTSSADTRRPSARLR